MVITQHLKKFMPKILITGNGFDLNLGLPTAYNDFIKILRYSTSNTDLSFESVYAHSCNHKEISERFKSFSFDKTNIEKLNELTAESLWFQFFKDEFEIETWIDFENKIEYVLKILFSSAEYIKEHIFSKGSTSTKYRNTYNNKILNNNIEIIEVLSQFNLIKRIYEDEFELNNEFLVMKYNSFIDLDLSKITNYFNTELIKFKIIFNYYFETFVFPFYDNLKFKVDRSLFMKINRHYTFNYTPTFEKIYANSQITKFLHGKINSVENKIVLGINEIPISETVEKKYFLPFTKYFQKLNNNTDYAFIREFSTKLNNNYLFFFWGHSLDKSDEDYLNEVFDFVNDLKTKTKKIIIIFHNEESKEKLLLNILNVRGKKDVQDLMRSQILEFLHVDSKALQKELNRDITNRPVSSTIMY